MLAPPQNPFTDAAATSTYAQNTGYQQNYGGYAPNAPGYPDQYPPTTTQSTGNSNVSHSTHPQDGYMNAVSPCPRRTTRKLLIVKAHCAEPKPVCAPAWTASRRELYILPRFWCSLTLFCSKSATDASGQWSEVFPAPY
jgi:hypothetical protein